MKKKVSVFFIVIFVLDSFLFAESDADAYLKEANKFYVNSKFNEAIELYSKALEIYPEFAEAYYNRGRCYQFTNNHTKAIEDFTSAYKNSEKYLNILSEISNDFYQKDEYKTAVLYMNRAIELQPENSKLFDMRGDLFRLLNNNNKAIEDYETAIKLNPEYAGTYNALGIVYDNLKNYEKAIENYNKVLELDPKYYWALSNIGLIYIVWKEYDKAVEYFTKAIELSPKYEHAFYNRGRTFYFQGNYKNAINDFEKAIKLKSSGYYSYTYLGACFIYTEKYKDALNILNKAIKINSKNEVAFIYKGLYYYFLKDYKNALKYFDKAQVLNPNYSYVYFLNLIASHKISNSLFIRSLGKLGENKEKYKKDKLEYLIALYMENSTTIDELINEAGDDNLKLCTVYSAIGYKYLFDNDLIKAKEFFQKSIDTKTFEFSGYKLVEKELSLFDNK